MRRLCVLLACGAAFSHPMLLSLCSTSSRDCPPSVNPGVEWTVRSSNGSVACPSTVPGQVQLDLFESDLIPDPYMDFNVDVLKWIPETPSWTWTATLAPQASLSCAALDLIAEGVDTAATLTVNGVQVMASSNAHVRSVTSLPPSLLSSPLNVTVVITSPLAAIAAAQVACNATPPYYCPPVNEIQLKEDGFTGAAYVRKDQSSFGWDFAPAFAPSGIHRPIYLLAYNACIITDVTYVPTPAVMPVEPGQQPALWSAAFTAYVRSALTTAATLQVSVDTADGLRTASQVVQLRAGGDNAVSVNVTQLMVQAWWPNGYGAATQYAANLSLTVGTEVATYSLLVGFRTVALTQPAAPNGGTLFQFSVNGQPLYVKGSNHVPADAFERRINATTLAPIVDAYVASNYNMVRVWGGGHYPTDTFYQLAAAAGLLVWQEFMFACALSPADDAFLSSVAAEVETTVKRLQKYSIALWSGNNEIEWEYIRPNSTALPYYTALNWDTVMANASALDTSRPLIGSSPSNGNETAAAPGSFDASMVSQGDMHVYVYSFPSNSSCWDVANYPRPRFASEFGWQSLSSLVSLAASESPQWWYFWSTLQWNRDHHPSQPMPVILNTNVGDNWIIPGPQPNSTQPEDEALIGWSAARNPYARDRRSVGRAASLAAAARASGATQRKFIPAATGRKPVLPTDADAFLDALASAPLAPSPSNITIFRDTLWMTGIAQAFCVRAEANHYRRSQNDCATDSAPGGCTAGTLYWMANAMWDGAEKSGLEYAGARWKPLQYIAARMYDPAHISGSVAGDDLTLTLSLHPPALGGVSQGLLNIEVWSWSAGLKGSTQALFTALPFGASRVWNGSLSSLLATTGCAPVQDCILAFHAFNASVPLASGFEWLAPPKSITTMRDPVVAIADVHAVNGSSAVFDLTVTAAVLPAALVWLESLLPGYMSDNAFMMWASPANITFYTRGGTYTEGQVAASLSVWTLNDVGPYGGRV